MDGVDTHVTHTPDNVYNVSPSPQKFSGAPPLTQSYLEFCPHGFVLPFVEYHVVLLCLVFVTQHSFEIQSFVLRAANSVPWCGGATICL